MPKGFADVCTDGLFNMTRLDIIAALAMAGDWAGAKVKTPDVLEATKASFRRAASIYYDMAEAMVAEGKKRAKEANH